MIAHGDLSDCIAAVTILMVSKSGMVGIELHQRIAIETHVDVVE